MTQQQSSRWDLCRFVKTLAFFGQVPILSGFEWFQRWLGSRPDPVVSNEAIAFDQSSASQDIALVVGANSDAGSQVIQQLLSVGYQVRAIATETIPPNANANIDWIIVDLSQPQSLSTALSSVQRVVICPSVLETPALSQAIATHLSQGAPADKQLFDFTHPSEDVKDIWGALDDVVMGGVSQSNFTLIPEAALFSGIVSTANSGGFASVRTRNFSTPLDVSSYDGVRLEVCGDGQRYKFMLRADTNWDSVAYCYSFDTVPQEWLSVQIPFTDLIPVFRAKTKKDAPPLATEQICAAQLMLSKFEYDGALNPQFQPGSFQLQVRSISVYGSAPTEPTSPIVSVIDSELDDNRDRLQALEASLQEHHVTYSTIPITKLNMLIKEP